MRSIASIKLDGYGLLKLFYANKEIARLSDPLTRHEALAPWRSRSVR